MVEVNNNNIIIYNIGFSRAGGYYCINNIIYIKIRGGCIFEFVVIYSPYITYTELDF